jgi:hypothetical protein
MENKLLNGAELARYTGVTRGAITTATKEGRLHREEITKKYDPNHSTNLAFINKNRVKFLPAELIDDDTELSTDFNPEDIPKSLENLYKQKLEMDIAYKSAQKRKLDLQFQKDKENLLPVELLSLTLGHFGSGIRNNFLTIAAKISRGDVPLRDRIEKEISRSITRTIETTVTELEKYSKKLIADMEVEQNEN